MEVVGELKPSEAWNLLAPGLSFVDTEEDDGEIVLGIRPKCSPVPRRRSSDSEDDDSGAEPPQCGSRRVSFADAKGLSLVCVKEFAMWDVPKPPGFHPMEGAGKEAEEYSLSLLFPRPLPPEELLAKVQRQKVELETIHLLPGTTTLRGVIRVLNISFDKMVYVRTTLDAWASHFDLLAEYVPGSCDRLTDGFSFKLTLVPPFSKQGARVDFCLRYETPVGTFWANNDNSNYALICLHKAKVSEEPIEPTCKKSCLKAASLNFNIQEYQSSQENLPIGVSTHMETASKEDHKVSDSQSGSLEGDAQIMTEDSYNCRRRIQRRAERIARARDHFAQNDETLTNTEREASLSEKDEEPKTPSNISDTCVEHSKVGGSQLRLELAIGSNDTYSGASTSSRSDQSKSMAVTGLLKIDTPASPIKPPHSQDEESCQHVTVDESMCTESSRVGEDEHTSNAAGEYKSNATPAESTDGLDCQTVVAPLYHQGFGQWGSERQNLSEQQSMKRFNLENLIPETVSRERNTIETQKSHQGSIHERMTICANVLAASSRSHSDNLKESHLEKCPREVVLTTPIPNVSAHLYEVTLEDNTQDIPRDLKCNEQQLDATTADSTLIVYAVDTACIVDSVTLQPHDSQILSMPATTDIDQTVSIVVAIENAVENTIEISDCDNDINEIDDRCVTASITTAHSNQDKQIEVMQDFAPDHITHLVKAAGNQNDPLYLGSKEDNQHIKNNLGITTSKTRSISGKDPNNVEGKNRLELKQNIDGTEVNELLRISTIMSNHNNTDTFVKCTDKDKVAIESMTEIQEPCEMKKIHVKREEINLEQNAEERHWETMVEEEQEAILAEDEGNGDKEDGTKVKERVGCGSLHGLLEGKGTEQVEMEAESIDNIENKASQKVVAVEVRENRGECVRVTGEERIGKEERLHADNNQRLADEDQASVGKMEIDKEEEGEKENMEEAFSGLDETLVPDEAGEMAMGATEVTGGGVMKEERKTGIQSKKDDSFTPLSNVHEVLGQRAIADKNRGEDETGHRLHSMLLHNEGGNHSYTDASYGQLTHSLQRDDRDDSSTARAGSCALTDEPESEDGGSSGSPSDEEVELYIHCLRAVGHASKDHSKGFGLTPGRRKHQPSSMPSIRESAEGEQLPSLQDKQRDIGTEELQSITTPLLASIGQEYLFWNVAWWKETCSCSNITKAMLYTAMLVLFFTVAYHYDFFACFALYLISVFWLCYQGDKHPARSTD